MSAYQPAEPTVRACGNRLELQTHLEREPEGISARFLVCQLLPATAISFLTHMLLIVLLAFLVIQLPNITHANSFTVVQDQDIEELTDFIEEMAAPIELNENGVAGDEFESSTPQPAESNVFIHDDDLQVASVDTANEETVAMDLADFGDESAPTRTFTKTLGKSNTGSSFIGNRNGPKTNIVGCTTETEKAVAQGLKWIVEHQNPNNGGWNFDHAQSMCNRQCDHAGKLSDCTTGATALALLPLLGAGQTHKEGKYKANVHQGLNYLVSRMKQTPAGGDFSEGSMYAHGLASIALCEAYAMTHDKNLIAPAQQSLNYISYAQDPIGGGWRYTPRQPGDTSVVGWQLMALKSGHIAYLKVEPTTVAGVTRFLDSVQGDAGATYGYTHSGNAPATSAVGLLSRMYLGWKQDNPALQRGVDALAKRGPVKGQFYYNYYATQVLRHNGGEAWENWNVAMRDSLVESQEKQGHATGSWYQTGDHGADAGGRLYCTSLATMILEVYYRHLPLYKKQATEDEFKL